MKEGRRPTIHDLPSGHPARDAVARQIIEARKSDRLARLSWAEQTVMKEVAASEGCDAERIWTNDRNELVYRHSFKGLGATFDHVRGLESKVVLDIGTGTSRGISEMSKSEYGKGLEFKGTSVTALLPEFDKYLGRENITITSAESLQGIENNSIGCVLALHSMSYTAEPQYVVARLNEVLVEGGVVKAVVDQNKRNQHFKEKDARRFVSAFKKLGYSVATSQNLVLAIKPFRDKSKSQVTAQDLIRQDKEGMPNVLEDLIKEAQRGY